MKEDVAKIKKKKDQWFPRAQLQGKMNRSGLGGSEKTLHHIIKMEIDHYTFVQALGPEDPRRRK